MTPTRFGRAAAALVLVVLGVLPASRGAPAVPPDAAPGPVWPLPLPTRYLTSNFMEFREGRFHAGIDLKTEQRAGFPVQAAEEGWIALLRASPDGYGRCIVLQGRSGRRYLYAHLGRFADRLRDLIVTAQQAAGRYGVELELPPGRLPVARGEPLALSGQSGTFGPHLHLEVRNAAGDALDPLRHGFAVPDTIPPRVLRVVAVPAAPDARVAGGMAARSVAAAAGLPRELPPLRVSGPVAFAAELDERSDVKGHHLAPRALRVAVDGAAVFAAVNDSFPLDRQALRRLEWLELAGRRAQWLWRRPQDDLPGRVGEEWSVAAGGLAVGRHRVEVAVSDAAGNAATVAWWLDVAPSDSAAPEAESAVSPAVGWVAEDVSVVLPWTGDGVPRRLTPFLELRESPGDAAAAWPLLGPLDAPPPGWQRLLLAPGDGVPLLAPAVLYVAPDTVTAAQARAARTGRGLVALGPAAWLLSPAWPAAGKLEVVWPGPVPAAAGDRDVAAYVEEGAGGWRYAGRLHSPADGGRHGWTLSLPGPGRYALLRDCRGPEIGPGPRAGAVRRNPVRQRAGIGLPRWEVVAIAVADAGSGVDPSSVAATLDGRTLVVEPDLAHGRLLAELPDNLTGGPHTLELHVADRAGVTSRRRLGLVLGAPH